MASIVSIIYFFVVTYGLGSSLLRFFEESDEPIEKHFMRIGLGLSLYIVLGTLMNLLTIPLNWWIFLALSLPLPLIDLKKWISNKQLQNKGHQGHEHKAKFKIKKATVYSIVALLIVLFCLFMYTKGAFSYTPLEDGDPWHHAVSSKYVSQEKTLFTNYPDTFRYLDAYPPGFAILMGTLYQLADEMVWTLKFFNALFIALGVMFFFLMSRRLTDDRTALIATFFIAMIPAYFSHFIWAHTLVVALFFPVFYCALMMKEKSKWQYAGAFALGGMILAQPTQPIKALVMLACLALVHIIHDKKMIKRYAVLVIGGILISALWWGPMIVRFDDVLRDGLGQKPTTNERWQSSTHFGPLGSATRDYNIMDFISVSSQNLMTAPIGIGLLPMLLAALGLAGALWYRKRLFKDRSPWLVIALWFIFTGLGLFGGTKLPLALFTFRFWLIFPIPLALLAAKGTTMLSDKAKSVGVPKIVTIVLLILLVGWTAGAVKYDLNTSPWPTEPAMMKYNQQDGYEFIRKMDKDVKIFDVCHRDKFGDTVLIGYDKYACPWCDDEQEFRKNAYDISGWTTTPEKIESFMKKKDYPYLFVEGNCVDTLWKHLKVDYELDNMEFAQESTNSLINNISQSGLFKSVHQTQGSVLFQLI